MENFDENIDELLEICKIRQYFPCHNFAPYGTQYAKPWPHSDIRSCCHQSLHAFTSRYDSTLLGCIFLYAKGVIKPGTCLVL